MSRAGETTIHTECTCSTHTATTTLIWRRSSLTLPPSALSLMDWNPPVTTWTITLPHGRLRSGQSSTPALQTPGYRSGGATVSPSLRFVTGVRLYPAAEARNTQEMTNLLFFHELGFIHVCFVDVCVWRRVQLSDNRWKDGMWAKEGNQGMSFFFLIIFYLDEKDGIMLWVCWEQILGHYSEETCVLLCLDVRLIFLFETLSCDSMVKGVSHVNEGPR